MRFTVQYPLGEPDAADEMIAPGNVAAFARAAEAAGFDALAFTEHPAPSQKWMKHGGHAAFDPFPALTFCAAVTERIMLQTYAAILPYRNPLLMAKTAATVDVLSSGRLVMAVGAGYLRSEFAALGVDFDQRNDDFDEALAAMIGIWTTEGFEFAGRAFTSLAQTAKPVPVQRPHPALWIAGNSQLAMQRVVDWASGWAPLLLAPDRARTTRTRPIPDILTLAASVTDLRRMLTEAGRDPESVSVQVESEASHVPLDGFDADRHVAMLTELRDAGATWFVVRPDASSMAASLECLARYGDEVIATSRAGRGASTDL